MQKNPWEGYGSTTCRRHTGYLQKTNRKKVHYLPPPKKVEEAEPQSKMTGFELNVHVGDLFVEPQTDVSLAHCVSRDLAMSAGIAKIFRKKFKHIKELKEIESMPEIFHDNTLFPLGFR